MDDEKYGSRIEKLTSLLDVTKAMASEHNLDKLLNLILTEVTRVMDAERSSLFLVDSERGELWSKIAQGLEVKEIRIKIGTGIAGFVALSGEVVNIKEAYEDPRFNKEVDRQTGYRTKTILCVPMLNKLNEIIGVLQVLNKHDGIFTAEDEELLLAFSGQAAVAIENAMLYENIEKLFEGFVHASVYAIESRDPTTFGHSERVGVYTVGLAETLDRVGTGIYADVHFSPNDVREIRYASLLHDFGKVGVRENVLVKANKLYEPDLQILISRFKFIKKTLESEYSQKKIAYLLSMNREESMKHIVALDREMEERLKEVDDFLKFILEANTPTVLPKGGFERLRAISSNYYIDLDGSKEPFLTTKEIENLSIGKGSLNTEERFAIESHVTHTFRFLQQIPWTKDMKRIPTIAYAHHEKLNGEGYPNRLTSNEIPLQSKMMTISDIYDALTAQDRPYKKSLPVEKAIDILKMEVSDNHIDPELLRIFIDAKIYALTVK